MPKKIDPKVKERCVRQVLEHLPEFPSLTAAAEAVARREGLGKETVRRWVVQAQIDGGQRQGATSEELAEIKDLKAKVRRLEGHNEILRRASIFFAGELDPRHRCFAGSFRESRRPLATVVAGGQAVAGRRSAMRKLKCRDAGFDCEGVIQGESTDEVLDLAGQHAKEVHGVDVTPEMVDAISMQIRDA